MSYFDKRKQVMKMIFLVEQNVSVVYTLTSMNYHDVLTWISFSRISVSAQTCPGSRTC